MTAENVSNEELLIDIGNTERELKAYEDIRNGFWNLSELPENEGLQRQKYLIESNKYDAFYLGCKSFLHKLYEIKAERNL